MYFTISAEKLFVQIPMLPEHLLHVPESLYSIHIVFVTIHLDTYLESSNENTPVHV